MGTALSSPAQSQTQSASTQGARRRYLTGYVIAVSCTLMLGEFTSRAVLSSPRLRQAILRNAESSAAYRLRWLINHARNPSLSSPLASYDATRGWIVRPNLRFKFPDGTIATSNTQGISGTREYPLKRTPEMSRAIVLGDSFSFGAEVNTEESYPQLLERMLPRSEVVNLAVVAYGHDQMLLSLKEQGLKYHPDVILLGFVYVDIYRNALSFFTYAKPQFELASPDNLKLTGTPVPGPEEIVRAARFELRFWDLIRILYARMRAATGDRDIEARRVSTPVLAEIASAARQANAVPLFVYMPTGDEIDPRVGVQFAAGLPSISERERYFESICAENRVRCISLRSRFSQAVTNGADFSPRHHWNKAAHELAARAIADELRRLGFR